MRKEQRSWSDGGAGSFSNSPKPRRVVAGLEGRMMMMMMMERSEDGKRWDGQEYL